MACLTGMVCVSKGDPCVSSHLFPLQLEIEDGWWIGLGGLVGMGRDLEGTKEGYYPKHSRARQFILQTNSNNHLSLQSTGFLKTTSIVIQHWIV